eukprot:3395680-Amphidinium_carterae.1
MALKKTIWLSGSNFKAEPNTRNTRLQKSSFSRTNLCVRSSNTECGDHFGAGRKLDECRKRLSLTGGVKDVEERV